MTRILLLFLGSAVRSQNHSKICLKILLYLNTNCLNDTIFLLFFWSALRPQNHSRICLKILLYLNTNCSKDTNLTLILGVGLATSKSLKNLLENISSFSYMVGRATSKSLENLLKNSSFLEHELLE